MKIKAKIILSFLIILFGAVVLSSCGSSTNDSANNDQSNSSGDEKSDSKNKYTVTWKNFNGDVLEIDLNVEDGAMPSYDSQTPKRPDTSSASYTFIGWDKEVVAVTGNVEYIATFREQLKTYTVIWKNYDGEVLETDYNVSYGTMPEYNGFTPSRQKTAENTYTFNNWDKELTAVTKNEEYIATYTSTVNQYTISFVDDNGINLSLQKLNYGDSIVSPVDPLKSSTAQYRYTFDGWYTSATGGTKVTSFGLVIDDVTFYARYTAVPNTYTVTWKDYDGKVLETDYNVSYGTMPEYNGATPTRTADNTYTYAFNGWDKTISEVTGNQEYIAVYTNTYKTYTVSISKNIQAAGNISGGGTYHYNDEVVLSASINSGYNFIGWYNGNTEVSKNISYKFNITTNNVVLVAKYASIEKCVVTFEVYASQLGIDAPEPQTIIKGETATQPDSLDTIITDEYTVTFGGWSKYSSSYSPFDFSTPITSNITIYAYWIVTVNKYTITYKNYDGEILQSSDVEYGTYPSYNGVTPTKPATEDYIFIFKGWDKEVVDVVGLETYTAVFEEKVRGYLAVTFMAKDSTNNYVKISETQIKEGDIPEFDGEVSDYKYGGYRYTFAGWYPTITNIYENTIYRAQYQSELLPYKINFDIYGGSGAGITSTRIELLSDLKTMDIFNIRKSNYKFVGWECNGIKVLDENGNIINDIDLEEEMTFKALYDESVLLTITYSVYDPINNTKLISTSKKIADMGDTSETMYCKWNTPVDLVADEGSNYTFVGWYLNNSLQSNTLELSYMIWEQDITLEARFKYVKVKLDVYSNNTNLGQVMIKDGNSQTWYDSQSKYSYYSLSMTIAAYSTSDAAFLGWYDINNNLVSTDSVYTFNMINVDYKLEAKWDYFKITYSFPRDKYCSNGGTNNPDNPTYYTSNMNNLKLYIPARNGFTFFGWEYNGEIIEEIATSNICHMTLTARWEVFEELSNLRFTWDDSGIYINGIIDKSVTEIIVPDYVTQISNGAFSGCTSLESITLPFVGDKRHISTDTYQYPLGYIFGTSSYTGGIETKQYYYGSSTTSTTNTTYCIPSTLKEVIITDCEYIQYGAFYGCSSLTSITIPNSVTSIGQSAFYKCSSLETITIPFVGGSATENTYLGYIFGASSYSYNSSYVPKSLKEVIISEGCTNIDSYAFYKCSSLTSITIPNSVTSIGQSAFYGCSSLTSITIPNSVTTIGERAFYNCSSLTSITIPNSVTSIGQYIFYNCSSLTNVVIPNSVTSIGQSSFYNCSSLQNVYFDGTIDDWCNITFSNEYSNPMYYASNLYFLDENGDIEYNGKKYSILPNELVIPNTVTSIKKYTFAGYKGTSIETPSSVTSIVDGAFYECSSLETITIPFVGGSATSNTYLGYIFGASSSSSNSSYVPESLKEVIISEGCTSIGERAFYGCSSLTSITIPNSVTSIGEYTFCGCSSLTSITIPNSVTSIGQYIFYGCSSLTSITIPNSVTTIGERAFYNCSSLTNVVIPNSVTSIGQYIFYNCSSLTNVVIPNSVTSIEQSSFYNCSSLQNVYFDGTIDDWCNITFSNEYSNPMYYATNLYFLDENGDIEYNGKRYSILPNELVIPNTVTSIKKYAFAGYKGTSIETPSSVTSLGQYAFYGCNSLETITLPFVGGSATSNTYLGYIFGAPSYSDNSSYVPTSLKEVIITDCEYIQYGAFYGCSSLTSITIPNSVTSIGASAFYGCSSLESITLPFVGDKRHKSIDTYQYPLGYIFGTSSYTGGIETKQYYYGSSTTSTTNTIYYIPSTLKEVIITDCEYIQYGAFYGCSSLETITIPFVGGSATSNTYLGYIFGASSYSKNSSYVPTSLKEVIISEGCTSIGERAFYDCSLLTSIDIPNSVTSIGSSAFSGCSSLKNVYFDGTIEEWCNITFDNAISNPMYFATNLYFFVENGDIEYNGKKYSILPNELVIPNTITSINKYTFVRCNVTSITIPSSVTTIEQNAFYICSSLLSIVVDIENSVYDSRNNCNAIIEKSSNSLIVGCKTTIIPDNVVSIASYAFYNYSSLTSITIPNSVTSIGERAFLDCISLTRIEIPNSVTSIGEYAFSGCSSLESITLPFVGGSATKNTYLGYIFGASSYYDNSYHVPISLKEVIISEGCTSIGEKAFYDCSLLTSIDIPNSVTTIGQYAFYCCNTLTSIEIPNSVTNIGSSAFSRCSSLGSITLPFIGGSTTENTYLGYIFGASSYSSNSSYVPKSLKEVIISEGCTSIGSYAFYNCSSLTSIEIPSSVTSIGQSAFDGCSSLQNVYYDGTSDEWLALGVSGLPSAVVVHCTDKNITIE